MLADLLVIPEAAARKWPILGAYSDRSELRIQTAFRKLIRELAPRVSVAAIPNGTHIASQAGRGKANAEGRSAGFPDMLCIWTGGVAFLEFKAGRTGKVSDAQAEWLTRIEAAGHPCCVSRDEWQAIDFLRGAGAPVALAVKLGGQ